MGSVIVLNHLLVKPNIWTSALYEI